MIRDHELRRSRAALVKVEPLRSQGVELDLFFQQAPQIHGLLVLGGVVQYLSHEITAFVVLRRRLDAVVRIFKPLGRLDELEDVVECFRRHFSILSHQYGRRLQSEGLYSERVHTDIVQMSTLSIEFRIGLRSRWCSTCRFLFDGRKSVLM
jgi:hypothetical protein